MNIDSSTNSEDICVTDSALNHTIFKDNKYFSYLVKQKTNISIISDTSKIIEGSGRANILLKGGTKLHIKMHYTPLSLI